MKSILLSFLILISSLCTSQVNVEFGVQGFVENLKTSYYLNNQHVYFGYGINCTTIFKLKKSKLQPYIKLELNRTSEKSKEFAPLNSQPTRMAYFYSFGSQPLIDIGIRWPILTKPRRTHGIILGLQRTLFHRVSTKLYQADNHEVFSYDGIENFNSDYYKNSGAYVVLGTFASIGFYTSILYKEKFNITLFPNYQLSYQSSQQRHRFSVGVQFKLN